MRIIRNKIIPFKGFKAMNLFGILFVRGDAEMSGVDMNHEMIHTAQMRELCYVFFYLLYVAEWIVRLFMSGDAYRNISFEREAYKNERNLNYLNVREPFSMWNLK